MPDIQQNSGEPKAVVASESTVFALTSFDDRCGSWVTRSGRFDNVRDANAAINIGMELVQDLAGPSVSVLREPPIIHLESVAYIKGEGIADISTYATAHIRGVARFTAHGVIQIDANGVIVEPPAPVQSEIRHAS